MSATGINSGRNQRSSSICLSNSQTFDAMKSSIGNRESSSGSDSPEVRREVIGHRPVKARQKAGRSKSERLQGANKPRITKRRDQAQDLNRANSGSLAGGLGITGKEEDYQSFMRKVPSVGAALMSDLHNDTPDGSPRLTAKPVRPSARPPTSSNTNVPAISTPELSPSLIRRATVNSAGRAAGGTPRPAGSSGGSRNSPVTRAKDLSTNKRATSVRMHGASSSLASGNNSSLRRSTFLDVPDSPGNEEDGQASGNIDEDSYRLRSFDLTRKGTTRFLDHFPM